MLPLTHTSHNTLVSICVKAQLKQLTRGKVIAQAKCSFSKNQRKCPQLWGRLFLALTWILNMPRLGQMLRQVTYHESQKPCFEGFLEILITLDLHNFSQVYKNWINIFKSITYLFQVGYFILFTFITTTSHKINYLSCTFSHMFWAMLDIVCESADVINYVTVKIQAYEVFH